MATKTITRSAAVAATYAVLTVVLAPVSYGPLQFRVAELLKPLALFAPEFALGFAVGTGMANLLSPFGPWDFIAMPVVDALAGYVCWRWRRYPVLALLVQAMIIAVGVAVFPLGFGGGLSPVVTFLPVLVSQVALLLLGWFTVWKPRREWVLWALRS